ncbi:MAG: sigma 54-interacting transcriptional regulator [Bdellovibrionaceae bacterium]|nr:sigma 54-interacting transcriptional regulator [Pseudobdellovibrionaceae bacterium]
MILHTGQKQIFFERNNTEKKEIKEIFISESVVMKNIYNKIKDLAYENSSVLILGARGTGCKTVAQRIFYENKYNNANSFVELSCYGLAHTLIDKKLFGGENYSKGLLSIGSEHTLFIKGLELWTAFLQNKMLSYLIANRHSNSLPRLIYYGTDRLSKKVQEGSFSQELFNVLSENLLIIPLLSERKEDIPSFVSLFNEKNGFKGQLTQGALQVLISHLWHGNIPELRNICLQISILYAEKDLINEEDLSLIIRKNDFETICIKYNPSVSLEDIINRYIELSMNHFKSKKESAKALGISVKTIYNKIKSGDVILTNSD